MTGKAPKGKGWQGVIFFYLGWLKIHANSSLANDLVADFCDVAWVA